MTLSQQYYQLYLKAFLLFTLLVFTNVKSTKASEISFDLAPNYLTGSDTYDTTFADLDGDGNIDAIAGNNDNATILTVLYGTGDGKFEPPVIIPLYGTFAAFIAVGDLSGDGQADIVIASFYQNKIATLFNQGNRQFSAPVVSVTPNPPPSGLGEFYDVEIADFDGDGNNDVVAVQDQAGKRLRFYHCDSQGVLTVFATLSHPSDPGSYEGNIAVGDINGDNLPDVAMSGGGPFGPRNISFVFGRTDGNLSFTYGFGAQDIGRGLTINDLDNDGDNDLAISFYDSTTPTQHSLRPFLNNGDNTFTFGERILIDYPFEPIDITSGDYNNDGKIDLAAIIFEDVLMVNYGRGNGTFTGTEYYAIFSSGRVRSVDLNHDNKLDLITASAGITQYNRISVVLNNNFRGFKAPRAVLWGPNYITAADFNNDGYRDLVSSWQNESYSTSSVDILLNTYNAGGGFLPEVSYPSGGAISSIKTGDFNGDGKPDIVSSHYNNGCVCLATHLGTGAGSVNPPVITPFSIGIRNILVADFNTDGRDDVFAVDSMSNGYIALANSDGTFTVASGSPFSVSNYRLHFQAGDFNNDNHLDIISELAIYLGDGNGNFVRSSVVLPVISHTAVADFNGDGNLDIAGVGDGSSSGSSLKGIFGDGKGGILQTVSLPFSGDLSTVKSLVSADFDLDGYPDVALAMRNEDVWGLNERGNLIFFRSGGSTPSWQTPLYFGVGLASESLIAEDFNGDGKTDLGFLGGKSRGVFYNTAVRTNGAKFDFDGDNKTDISIFRPNKREWWYLRSSDEQVPAVQFGQSTDKIAPADFTGDGKTDIAFFRPSEGIWYVLRSEDNSFYAFPFGISSDIPVPADFDGDGKADPTVFRPSNAVWYTLRSSDGQVGFQQFGVSEDIPLPNDFDGDGKADFGVFRPTPSEWWILKSTGGTTAVQFGTTGDNPVPADYTGDGKTDIAFFRPSDGFWYVLRSEDNSYYAFPFGTSGDKPVAGDYDGDGRADAAVFRSTNTTWYLQQSTSGFAAIAFGVNGDHPVPAAYLP